MLKNLIEKMTWLRAALLAVMTAMVIALSIADFRLAHARLTHRPVFIGQVDIPPEPTAPADEPSLLLDVPVYGEDDDGILDPTLVIGQPLAQFLEDHPEFVQY